MSSDRRTGTVAKSSLDEGGGGKEPTEKREKERERRDFSLHEAAVSSSGNYSAGLADPYESHGTCVGRSLVEEEEEEGEAAGGGDEADDARHRTMPED